MCAGLLSRQLTAQGIDVLVLERGVDHGGGAEARLPSQRDELRWAQRQGNMQNWQRETYTLRHSRHEESLPVRWMEAFLPGEGVGGAGSHWNGVAWRWSEYDPTLRTRYESRYGKKIVPADMPLQDWGTTYAELEPYHDLFEKLFGLSGKAGNIAGKIQPGGNPFEAPRRGEYPQAPLEITEAGSIFKAAAESLGLKPFPGPAANSSGDYLNPDGQRLGRCQYCGHCERFICEAHAKGTPDRLLYPMLKTRKGFEIRTRAQVLRIDYDGLGDSAGVIAPVAGDGMGMALQAGQMTSHLLDLYLTDQIPAADLCERYTTIWWQTFGLRLRLSRVLQAFMLRPNWLTPGLLFMNAVPAVGHWLVTHTRDNQLARP
jgi:gluconate 2-dehydrogenase alpha chain